MSFLNKWAYNHPRILIFIALVLGCIFGQIVVGCEKAYIERIEKPCRDKGGVWVSGHCVKELE